MSNCERSLGWLMLPTNSVLIHKDSKKTNQLPFCTEFLYTSLTLHDMDIHIQVHKTDLYKRSVINMGTKLYNKLPSYIKGIDSYKTFKRELKSLLLMHSLYSVEEFLAL